MSRKDYWNEKYVDYWKSRVEESNESGKSDVVQGDARTEGEFQYEELLKKYAKSNGAILDIGCAWGRMFPLFVAQGMKISGVDISDAMIANARGEWGDHASVALLKEAEAEVLPFEDNSFDTVFCAATFDATHQHEALTEMIRVCKVGGVIFFTGKNSDYHSSDELALAAEEGARKKGHPNYFTQITKVIQLLEDDGHAVLEGRFYERRGDFAEEKYQNIPPRKFYEYFLAVRRGECATKFESFSSGYSNTYRALNGDNSS